MIRCFQIVCWVVAFAGGIGFSSMAWSEEESFAQKLSQSAFNRTQQSVTYDGRYFPIKYPGGDIPSHLGVCSDLVIRSYRTVGIDLQERVHEDIKANFELYPRHWGMKRPDSNIDHRRVPNLQVFFERHGASIPVSHKGKDYLAGDVVTWNLRSKGWLPHIGIVSGTLSADGKRPLIVHNIGRGPVIEDMLFDFKITGHYRYPPQQ